MWRVKFLIALFLLLCAHARGYGQCPPGQTIPAVDASVQKEVQSLISVRLKNGYDALASGNLEVAAMHFLAALEYAPAGTEPIRTGLLS